MKTVCRYYVITVGLRNEYKFLNINCFDSVNIDNLQVDLTKITLLRLDGLEVHISVFADLDIIQFVILMGLTEL